MKGFINHQPPFSTPKTVGHRPWRDTQWSWGRPQRRVQLEADSSCNKRWSLENSDNDYFATWESQVLPASLTTYLLVRNTLFLRCCYYFDIQSQDHPLY